VKPLLLAAGKTSIAQVTNTAAVLTTLPQQQINLRSSLQAHTRCTQGS
jgi:hypothetical protein